MEFEISLNELHFYSFHGVFEEERKLGNEFIVNLSVKIPCNDKVGEDDLNATVSYAELFEIVEQEMEKPKQLLERVCLEISKAVSTKFPVIKSGRISIRKLRPPIADMIGSAEVTLNF